MEYLASRERRRELAYEAMLAAGRTTWRAGERVRVYRAVGGEGRLAPDGDAVPSVEDARDYDAEHYVRLLRDTYAARLARGLAPEDFATVFADPDQLSLFAARLEGRRGVLTVV